MNTKFPLFSKIRKTIATEFFDLISRPRGVFLLFFIFLMPFFATIHLALKEKCALDEMKEKACELKGQIHKWSQMTSHKNQFIEKYKNCDHHFLDHKVETCTFLESELQKLQFMQQHPSLTSCDDIEKKLQALTFEKNHMFFKEISNAKGPYFEEKLFRQLHPVKVNFEDSKRLLCMIEGVEISPYSPSSDCPQFIITNWEMKKNLEGDNKGIYLLKMELIQRH